MLGRQKPVLSNSYAHRWLKTHPLVIVAHLGHELFVLMQAVAVFISLHPQYCLQPSTLEELMNGGIQTLASLYGITMTGCQRRCDFVVFRRTGNVKKRRVNVYSL